MARFLPSFERWTALLGVASALSSATLALPTAQAASDAELQAFLSEFETNPVRAMNRRIQKKNARGERVPQIESAFPTEMIRSGDYISARDRVRAKKCTFIEGQGRVCLDQTLPGRAPIAANDHPSRLVDNSNSLVETLEEMETKNLRASKLDESPWSDDYWPIYRGILGNRYADSAFPADKDWRKNHDYVKQNDRTVTALLQAPNATSIDTLSPSEKYELLLGDSAGSMTQAMWEEGEQYQRASGKVEEWMGICHGWAAAAYMVTRPAHAITLTAADGKTKIRFFPSDIKGLASLLWAKTDPASRFIGGRCNDKNPKMDKNGRVISQECFDTNPGTWHLSVVNQIGVSKRSFIIDATYDYEVWNQPVVSYTYRYFNPETGKPVSTLAQAKVPMASFTKDKFKSYRSRNAAAVVGISMDVTYTVETQPSHRTSDGPANDLTRTASYTYDVELDASGKIIGGEWYTNLHPDFLWTPPKGTRATSSADRYATGTWDGKGAAPASWRRAAAAAGAAGIPLEKVVNLLSSLSAAGVSP
jgi:hypothetical protein